MDNYYLSTDMDLAGVVSVALKLDPKLINKGLVAVDGKIVKDKNYSFKFKAQCRFPLSSTTPVVTCGSKSIKLINVEK